MSNRYDNNNSQLFEALEDIKNNFSNVELKKLVLVIISVVLMGFSLSFLNKTNMGTDPCTMFNLGMSRLLHISLGNWQAMFNMALLIIVIIFGRDQIGWGTLANMFLVGYSFDFFTWLNGHFIPDTIYSSMLSRVIITIPALMLFIIAAATYMAVQLGTSPYDAISFIISVRIKKLPFKIVRIIYDVVVMIGGFLLGSKLGIVTIIMAFALGPVVTWIRINIIDRFLY